MRKQEVERWRAYDRLHYNSILLLLVMKQHWKASGNNVRLLKVSWYFSLEYYASVHVMYLELCSLEVEGKTFGCLSS